MTSASPTARLDIEMAALLHNFRVFQARTPRAAVAPVVKADAYGLGMAAIAPFLARHGAQTFFVARLGEGIGLRKILGQGATIYVLDGLQADETTLFSSNDLRPVLNSLPQVKAWCAESPRLKAALHIDTGMNRLGIRVEDIGGLPALPDKGLTLVMSHLACGDEPGHPLNDQQLTRLNQALPAFPHIPVSMANSAGAFLDPAYHFDLTRPGIGLYGGGPFGAAHPDIQAVAKLFARVLQVRDMPAGESVGYGATFMAPRPMRLATLGVGYADGLLRSLAAKGSVWIDGHKRPFAGRISMDVCSVDATGLSVAAGDWVEILGDHQNLDDQASAAGTIGYEILTRLGPRLPRTYIGA